MLSADLGNKFGIDVTPNIGTVASPIAVGVGQNNNYAAGGAHIGVNQNNVVGENTWSTEEQIDAYLNTNGRADANTLYIYYIGTNDLKSNYIVNRLTPEGVSLGAGYLGDLVDGVNYINNYAPIAFGTYVPGAMNVAGLDTLAGQAVSQVNTLYSSGARFIVIPNIDNADENVANLVGLPWTQMRFDSVAYYNQKVWNDIAADGINFIPADFASLQNYIGNNPTTFGFTNFLLSNPACTVGSIECTNAELNPNPETYFFADTGGHLSAAGQKIESDLVYSLITAPSKISLLNNTPVKTSLSNVETIRNQANTSTTKIKKLGTWASAQVGTMDTEASSTGFSGSSSESESFSAGFDYRISNKWLTGIAFTNGQLRSDFDLGGNNRQTTNTVSPYAFYNGDMFWHSTILSAGMIDNKLNRKEALGISTQSNVADASGKNYTIALEFGKNFEARLKNKDKKISHGPVLGFVNQSVTTDAFTETNASGAPTALSYDKQELDSRISQLGYQANAKLGTFAPSVKLTWNHEWADTSRNVTANLTSTSSPSFYMPGVELGEDWASLTTGVTKDLTKNIKGFASFNTEQGQTDSSVYTGSIGVKYEF